MKIITSYSLVSILSLISITGCIQGSGNGRKGTLLVQKYQQYEEPTPEEEEYTPARPDQAVIISSDFCSCLEQKADIYNNCDSFCAGKPYTDSPYLFVNTTLLSSITLDEEIGNLYNWCTKEISGLPSSPVCELEVDDGNGVLYLPVILNDDNNSFIVKINPVEVPEDVRFVARLVEKTTGAASTSFQFRRIRISEDNTGDQGPLTIMPISMYSCIERIATIYGTLEYYNKAGRIHYYFPSNDAPIPLAAGNTLIFCHDTRTHGEDDSALFPRLELISHVFNLWNLSDYRFYDIDPSDGILDINGIIQTRLLEQYQVSQTVNIFGDFRWPNGPNVVDENSEGTQESTNVLMGYYMQPFLDSETREAFCPTQYHYNELNNPIFDVLKELVEIDTEGIYLAIREPIVLRTQDGQTRRLTDDILIIRESLLKQIWFYIENGQHYVPDDETANSKTIMFYWPPSTGSPLTKSPSQKVYTVKSPENIGQATQDPSELRTSIRPPDKRFGCVPVMSID